MRTLSAMFLSFLFVSTVPAQSFKKHSGTTAGLNSVALTDANHGTLVGDSGTILRTTNGIAAVSVTDIDSVIHAYMLANSDPGLAACIVKGGRIVWEGYYGLANITIQDSIRPSTIFILASVSKTVMVTALMQLWQRGRFQLDDSVNAYLPFVVRNPYFPSSVITFRQLLCHVSSIHDTWSQMPDFMGDPPIALGTYLREYLTPGGSYYSTTNYSSSHPPASVYDYSNVGASLCGYLVEVMSGIPFDQYCRDSIFVPLEMTNTAWFLRDLNTPLIAHPYHWNGSSFTDYGLYGMAIYPAGQLRTTLRSLARFLMASIDFGNLNTVRILDSATVRLMRTAQYPSIDPTQGLIWYTVLMGQRQIWGHRGDYNGVRTGMWLDEQGRTGVIMLANFSPEITTAVPMFEALFAMADTITVGIHGDIAGTSLPSKHRLEQNYPNPFNPSTTIRYSLPHTSFVTLTVYNTLGQRVAQLVNEQQQAGNHDVVFRGDGLASGVYFYRLDAGGYTNLKKLILLK